MSAAQTWIAEPREAEIVARLMVGFRDDLGKDWPSENAFLAGVERLLDDRDCDFVLGSVDADSPPAGIAALRFRHCLWTASPDCWVEDVFVEPEARGTGLGRALMDEAFARARERGCRRIELDVNEDNAVALGLYEATGFGKKSGPWGGRDILLSRRLDQD